MRVAERDDAISLVRRGELDLAVIEAHTDAITPSSRSASATQPIRRIFAVTRAAVSSTAPVQMMITVLKTQADPHRR